MGKRGLNTGAVAVASLDVTYASDDCSGTGNFGNQDNSVKVESFSDWQYNRTVDIKENSGNDLTGYQVLINLSGNNFLVEANESGADIRFVDVYGTVLNYWIEEYNHSAKEAWIWVKVPEIPANQTVALQMYWGNPMATSMSDGDATFEFFDDFEGTSLDTWKWCEKGEGLVSINSSVIHTVGKKAIFSNWDIDTIFSRIIEVKGKLRSAHKDDVEIGFGYVDSSSLWHGDRKGEWITAMGWDYKAITIADGLGGEDCFTSNTSSELWNYSGYYTYYIKFESNHVRVEKDDVLILDLNASWNQTNSNLPVLIVFDHLSDLPNYDEYVDWVRVRKYAPLEPAVSYLPEKPREFFVTGDASGNVYIFPSYGNGSFAHKVLIGNIGSGCLGSTIADYDNDSDLDVTIQNENGDSYLFFNNGTNGFQGTKVAGELELHDSSGESAAADFNNDGYMDFIVTSSKSSLYLFTNNKNGTFSKSTIDAEWFVIDQSLDYLAGLDVGNFNEDENMDFLIAGKYYGGGTDPVYLYFGNGDGTFTHEFAFNNSECAGKDILAVVAGDFDKDGHCDALVGQDDDGDPGQTWLYKGEGTGGFTYFGEAYDTNPSRESGGDESGAGYADAFDFDGDGNLDVIACGKKVSGGGDSGTIFFKGNNCCIR